MAIDFRQIRLTFHGRSTGGLAGAVGSVDFDSPVVKAEVLIKSYSLAFVNADRDVQTAAITTSLRGLNGGKQVTVAAFGTLNDASQASDEEYVGTVEALVVADVQ